MSVNHAAVLLGTAPDNVLKQYFQPTGKVYVRGVGKNEAEANGKGDRDTERTGKVLT